jgi:eukaryotic translation initiation factor 2C
MQGKIKSPPKAIVIFLPEKPSPFYGVVKRFGDVDKGVVSQVMITTKARKGNERYYHNVSLKLNVKLGGINSVLDQPSLSILAKKGTMVFGADVTHQPPGSLAPSIAAVVGTMDKNCAVYGSSIKLQNSRKEVIVNLDGMVLSLLKQHIATNGRPSRIIFFRDGVSSGQFSQVLSVEVPAIRAACLLIDRSEPYSAFSLTYLFRLTKFVE